MRSLRALAANVMAVSDLWTMASCRIRSTFSFSTCKQDSLEEGKHHEVQGTVAIVTGGNGGLGQRICHALAQAGSHIAVVYTQSQAQAQEVAGQLRQTGVQAEAMVYNVPGRSVWSSGPACSLLHPRSSPARAPSGLPSYRPPTACGTCCTM